MFGRIRSEVIRGDVGKGHWIPDKYRITTLLTERQRSLSERREYTLVESLRKFPPAAVEPQRRTKRGVLVTVYIHTSPSSGTHARLQQNLHSLFVQYRPQPSRFLLWTANTSILDCHVALLFFIWSQRSAAEWHGGLKMRTEPPEGGRGSGTGRANSDSQRIVRDCWQFLEFFNAT